MAVLSNMFIIELVSAWDEARGWNYYYLRIPGDKYLNFKSALSEGAIALEDYGEIVRTGSGRGPSEVEKARFEKELGVDHQFKEKIFHLVSDLDTNDEETA